MIGLVIMRLVLISCCGEILECCNKLDDDELSRTWWVYYRQHVYFGPPQLFSHPKINTFHFFLF